LADIKGVFINSLIKISKCKREQIFKVEFCVKVGNNVIEERVMFSELCPLRHGSYKEVQVFLSGKLKESDPVTGPV